MRTIYKTIELTDCRYLLLETTVQRNVREMLMSEHFIFGDMLQILGSRGSRPVTTFAAIPVLTLLLHRIHKVVS